MHRFVLQILQNRWWPGTAAGPARSHREIGWGEVRRRRRERAGMRENVSLALGKWTLQNANIPLPHCVGEMFFGLSESAIDDDELTRIERGIDVIDVY